MKTIHRTQHGRGLATMLLLLAIASAHELRAECIRGYAYSAPITITNPGPTPLTDYQIPLAINTTSLIAAGKMRPEGADLRFALDGDCCSPLAHWVESGMNSDSTVVWVKVPSIPAGGSVAITMFYGNADASDASDPTSVFPLFDGFDDSQLDAGRWEMRKSGTGQVEINRGSVTFRIGSDSTRGTAVLVSRSTFPTPVVAEMMVTGAHGMWPHLTVQIPGTGRGYGPFLRDRAMLFGATTPGGIAGYEARTFLTSSTAGNVNGVWNVSWWGTTGESISWPDGLRPNYELLYAQYEISPTVALTLGVIGPGPGDLTVDWIRVRAYADPAPTATAPGSERIEPSPVILAQPEGRTVCAGAPATLSVVSDGASFQWRRDGVPIPDATGRSLTIAAATTADTGDYDVMVWGPSCGPVITSNRAKLALSAQPTIVMGPRETTVCAGTALALDVRTTGSGITYVWRKNGVAIPGATDARYLLPAASMEDAGSYDVMIVGRCGEVSTSATATVTVLGVPAIAEGPRDTTVCRNMTFTLSASVTGAGLRCQWRRNGMAIPGATSPSYSHRAQPYDDGVYDLVVTGACGTAVTSTTARVTVTTEPIISEGPIDRSVAAGEEVTFSVRASGGGSLRYQWRKDGVDIPGAISPRYTIASASATDVGTYDVVVSGTTCTAMEMVVVSERAVLALDAPLAIVTGPVGRTVCAGGGTWFAVNATGTDLRYQWRKDGIPIAGAVAPLHRIDTVTAADAGSYDVVVTGADGTHMASDPALLTIPMPATITSGPADVTVCAGEMIELVVSAAGDGLGYQWRRDGVAIAGATGPHHTIAAAATDDAGRYDVAITGSCGDTVRSQTALVTVYPATSITRDPAPLRVRTGERASFSVESAGSDLRYIWEHDGRPIAGAEGATYTIEHARTSDGGTYRAVVTGRCSPADTSATAMLSVEGTSGVPGMMDDADGNCGLTVLPQPARGQARLLVTLPAGLHPTPGTRLTLIDASGREVADLSESFARKGFTGADLDTGLLPSGSYYCRIDIGRWSRLLGAVMVAR